APNPKALAAVSLHSYRTSPLRCLSVRQRGSIPAEIPLAAPAATPFRVPFPRTRRAFHRRHLPGAPAILLLPPVPERHGRLFRLPRLKASSRWREFPNSRLIHVLTDVQQHARCQKHPEQIRSAVADELQRDSLRRYESQHHAEI